MTGEWTLSTYPARPYNFLCARIRVVNGALVVGKSDYAPNVQRYFLKKALSCDEARVKLVLQAE
jgi:hypothetical protein